MHPTSGCRRKAWQGKLRSRSQSTLELELLRIQGGRTNFCVQNTGLEARVARREMRKGWVSCLRLFLICWGLDSLYKAVRIAESLRGDETHHSGSYLGTDVRGTRGHLLVFVEVYSERFCHASGLCG